MYKVYRKGIYPKPKKYFYNNEFITRQKARNFCRNRSWEELTIVHSDGKEELWKVN